MTLRITRAATTAVFAGTLLFGGSALAQEESKTAGAKTGEMKSHKMDSMKGADSKFAMEAAQGGMAEVQLGKLATEKASSSDVKQFGQRMVDDHSKANDELKSIASQKGMTLPSDMGAKNQAEYDRLSKLSGAAFDKAYMRHMTTDHKKDVAEFQKESNSGKDSEIKSFAAKTLPTLQEHLKMAQDINGKVSGATSADRSK